MSGTMNQACGGTDAAAIVEPHTVGDASESATTRPPVTLASLLDTLGPGLMRVAVAPRGLGIGLSSLHIYDPQDSAPDYEGGMVLGVGIDSQRADSSLLLEMLASQHGVALVLKSHDELPPRLRQTAEQAELAIITIPPDASWAQVHGFVRTAMGASGAASRMHVPGQAALGNLFRLADAIAAMVGGATTIEDPDSVVLAYSSGDAPIDMPRQRTILGHRVPEDWMRKLHDAGVFKRLLSGDDVVYFEDPDGEIRPRLAVAVRAGGELLGSLWVAEGAMAFSDTAKEALRDAANIAALHLIQHRNMADYERSRRSENLRAVLRGDLPASVVIDPLHTSKESTLTVAAFQLPSVKGPELSLKLQRLVDLMAIYCAAYRRSADAVVVADAVYLLLVEREMHTGRIRSLVQDLSDRGRDNLKTDVRVGLSRSSKDFEDLRALRHEADQVMRVLREAPRLGPVASIDELRSQAVLLDLREFFKGVPSVLEGKLQQLMEEDERRGTGYVDTLRAYLEHFGDINSASAEIHVHSNTFRYRMNRLSQLSAIDLTDPDERLVLQIQLRLMQ